MAIAPLKVGWSPILWTVWMKHYTHELPKTLAALLMSYVEKRNAPAFLTSRPQGVQTINRFGDAWGN